MQMVCKNSVSEKKVALEYDLLCITSSLFYITSLLCEKINDHLKMQLKITFPISVRKMILIVENMLFSLKYHTDWHYRLTF